MGTTPDEECAFRVVQEWARSVPEEERAGADVCNPLTLEGLIAFALARGRRAAALDMRERCKAAALAQPYFPDTHTGMRQQWVKEQIAAAIDALEP